MRRLIEEQAKRAATLLGDHRSSLEAAVEVLVLEGRLSKGELLALLTPEERALAAGSH